ncbi:MAG: peptidase M15 [Pseudomonadota bacterium]|nr:peptidase M15 [Pseudomonadota bacterium]
MRSFRDFLADKSVQNVVPLWQLVRTSSSWRQCSAGRFEVAPAGQWQNIVQTLAFVKNEVQPAIGEVEALSGFRNSELNGCSNGKPRSAHRMFFAMDLVPAGEIDRGDLVARLCTAHAQRGPQYSTGLGFYSGSRFHVDSSGFRKWGSDGRGATSPCNGGFA